MKRVLLSQTFILGLLMLLQTADALACSCELPEAGKSTQQQVSKAKNDSKAVFSATVRAITKEPQNYFVNVTLIVEDVWKGELAKEVTLTTGSGGGDCGYPFEVGANYLIYAYSSQGEYLSTNICQRTNRLSAAAEDLKVLGKGIPALKSNSISKVESSGEEYAVYSSVLRKVYADDRKTYSSCCEFVIVANTKTDKEAWEDSFDFAKDGNLFKDFERKNTTTEPLSRRLPFAVYHFVSEEELDKLFAEGKAIYEAAKARQKPNEIILGTEYWIPFYTKYPESAGVHTLSRVGFDAKRSLALVNVTFRSNLVGFSRMYVLSKKGRQWSILNWSGMESIS